MHAGRVRLGGAGVKVADLVAGDDQVTYLGGIMTINTIVSGLGALAGIVAAGFWFGASLVPVPDNVDTFIGVLQRASRLNAYAASAAFVAALCVTYLFARQLVEL